MVDEHIEIHHLYPSLPEGAIDTVVHALINNGCRADSDGGMTDWRVRIDGERDSVSDVDSLVQRLEAAGSGSTELWAERMPVKVWIDVDSGLVPLDMQYIGVSVSNLYVDRDHSDPDDVTAEEHLGEFLRLSNVVYRRTEPSYGFGKLLYSISDRERYRPARDQVLDGRVEDLFWANYFSPAMVDHVGRARLETAPAYRRELLHDGGILVVANPYPFEFGPHHDRAERVAEHLGLTIP